MNKFSVVFVLLATLLLAVGAAQGGLHGVLVEPNVLPPAAQNSEVTSSQVLMEILKEEGYDSITFISARHISYLWRPGLKLHLFRQDDVLMIVFALATSITEEQERNINSRSLGYTVIRDSESMLIVTSYMFLHDDVTEPAIRTFIQRFPKVLYEVGTQLKNNESRE